MSRVATDCNGRKYLTNEPLLHPPKREWVGLSFGEARKLIDSFDGDAKNLVYDIEAKLQEKNT